MQTGQLLKFKLTGTITTEPQELNDPPTIKNILYAIEDVLAPSDHCQGALEQLAFCGFEVFV